MKGLEHLGRTWLIDLDGTVTAHNTYLTTGDALLPGVKDLWSRFSSEDRVILLTAREERYRDATLSFLVAQGLRHDVLLMGLPHGARILVNDCKPDGTPTAYSVNLARDQGLAPVVDLIGAAA
jgi:uncharacterized HAD superfamily protein